MEILSGGIYLEDRDSWDVELVWEPGRLSCSPFYPYWKVSLGKEVCYITQEGKVVKEIGKDE